MSVWRGFDPIPRENLEVLSCRVQHEIPNNDKLIDNILQRYLEAVEACKRAVCVSGRFAHHSYSLHVIVDESDQPLPG